MIPVHSKIGKDMRIHSERLVSWYGRKQSTETNHVNNSQQSGNEYGRAVRSYVHTKTLNAHLAPIGDDVEPIEASREDVEVGNDEDEEEPWEAEVPQSKN